MKVFQLKIENFRGIKAAELRFDGHALLVGANNVGKSTVCEALDLVLGPDRLGRFPPVEEFDFYYGSGSVWSAKLTAMLFSILQTVVLWGINPRHWLHDYLSACAENGGLPPADLTAFLPWTMDEARLNTLKQPLNLPFPVMPISPPDTS